MRVIVLNDHGRVNGGAAQVAISSLNALAQAGLDVTFISSVPPVAPGIRPDLVRIINFGFHDLLGNPSKLDAAWHGIWDARSGKRLRALLHDYSPSDTIIHLHSWVQSLSSSVVHTARELGFEIVCTLHDYFAVCPNGGLFNFRHRAQCQLEPMSLRCVATNCDSRSYSQKLWRVGRQYVQNNAGSVPEIGNFITVSEYSESLLRPLLPAGSRFFRVRNPIDIPRLPPSDIGNSDAFTFVGRLSPEKGPDVFAAAAQQAGVKAAFTGTGPEDATIIALNPQAEFHGWQDRTGVVDRIRRSRAVVLPSLSHETQGLVVMEAAALGVPAIVSDRCAARDSVVDGVTGLLFRTGDVSDLAAKLTLLKQDSNLAETLGRKAYEHYWKNPCSLEAHIEDLITCYERVLGGQLAT